VKVKTCPQPSVTETLIELGGKELELLAETFMKTQLLNNKNDISNFFINKSLIFTLPCLTRMGSDVQRIF